MRRTALTNKYLHQVALFTHMEDKQCRQVKERHVQSEHTCCCVVLQGATLILAIQAPTVLHSDRRLPQRTATDGIKHIISMQRLQLFITRHWDR